MVWDSFVLCVFVTESGLWCARGECVGKTARFFENPTFPSLCSQTKIELHAFGSPSAAMDAERRSRRRRRGKNDFKIEIMLLGVAARADKP